MDMMESKKSSVHRFFEEDPPHGMVKRMMLKKYVQAFIPKILNTRDLKAIIIDGFAGPGRYTLYGPNDSGWALEIEKYGSPMIILIAALQYFYNKSSKNEQTDQEWDHYNHAIAIWKLAAKRPQTDTPKGGSGTYTDFRLRLFFVEKNKEHYSTLIESVLQYLHAFLEQIENDAETSIAATISYETVEMKDGREKKVVRVSHDKYPIECTIVRGAFETFEPPTRSKPTNMLTFLDPFGYGQIPMRQVKKFLQDHSSVFITFMSKYVDLNKGLNPVLLEKLYGEDLVVIVLKEYAKLYENDPTARRTCYSREYIKRMKTHTSAKYALAFEMRKGIGGDRYNKHNKPNDQGEVCPDELIHHMLYFSDHREGLRTMKEAMNTCSQCKGEFKMSDYKVEVEGIPLHIGNDQDNWVVANEVFKKFKGETVELGEVENFVLEHTPFVFRHGILKIMEEEYKPRLIKVDSRNKRVGVKERMIGTFPNKGKWEGSVWMLTFSDELDKFKHYDYRNLDMNEAKSSQDKHAVAVRVFDEFQSKASVPIDDVKRFVQKVLCYEAYKATLKILEVDQRLKSVDDANGSTGKRRKGTYPGWGNWRLTFKSKVTGTAYDEPQAGPSGARQCVSPMEID